MASYDDKMVALQEVADRAADRAGQLSESEWPDAESRGRLGEVLAYSRLVIAGSEGALVSDSAASALQATLAELADTPEQVALGFEPWVERVLDQLSRLPAAQGHDFEQQAKEAAKTFERSARQRLSNLGGRAKSIAQQVEGSRARMEEISTETKTLIDAGVAELNTAITELQTAFEGRLQQYESTLETEREESVKQRGAQAAEFEQAQIARASEASDAISGLEAELKQRSEEAIAGLERSRERVAALVDLVTTSTTSGGFGAEANNQKTEGDKWRWRAVIFGLLATGVAVFAVIYAVSVEVKTSLIVAKLAVVVTLAGLAGYAAKQSAEHRGREVRARRLELELTAFGPFTEALGDVEKERAARVAFIDRIFVGEQGLPETTGDSPATLTSNDVSLLGQIFEIFRKATK